MRLPLPVATAGARALRLFPAEKAHDLTIAMLESSIAPKVSDPRDPRLSTTVAGLTVPNPIGLAAGFDKNARVPDALLGLGFGFIEVGAVTPKPQPGNDKPRVFRLRHDKAVINRYGFNNEGLDVIGTRLSDRRRKGAAGIVGVNLGANKDSEDRIEDFCTGINGLAGCVEFFTVNISSPNTPGLRALQDRNALAELLRRTKQARNDHAPGTPLFLKLAPDLTETDKQDIADLVQVETVDALIISNTTLARPDDLVSRAKSEAGGLSGEPLFALSTEVLGEFFDLIGAETPLIGVGGVASARDAYRKILNGASLVQLYTALVYHGPGLIRDIIDGLGHFLDTDGYTTISQAVGQGRP